MAADFAAGDHRIQLVLLLAGYLRPVHIVADKDLRPNNIHRRRDPAGARCTPCVLHPRRAMRLDPTVALRYK